MDHMDLIRRKSNVGYINLADTIIIAAKTSQKFNNHLGEAMNADDCEDFMKATEKRNKIFEHIICLGNPSKIIASKFSTHNTNDMELQKKKKLIWRTNQTQSLFMCTWWYATRRDWFSQHVSTC